MGLSSQILEQSRAAENGEGEKITLSPPQVDLGLEGEGRR